VPPPRWWANPNVISGVISFLVSVAVSFVVALVIGPWRASREEAARRDRVTRWRVARRLKALRVRIVQERRRREQRIRQESHVVRKEPLTVYDFERGAWPAVALLDDPTISRRTKSRVRSRLVALLGQERVLYLESLSEAPENPQKMSDVTTRIVESRVLEDNIDSLVDRMMQNYDIQTAEAVVQDIDRIIRVLS